AVRWIYDEERLREELEQESRRARRHGRPLSILLVRVEGFDALQGRYGRFLAEQVLRQVAARLDDAKRDTDFLGASGENGFVAILVEADADGAARAEERLIAGLEAMELPRTDLPDLDLRLACATATQPEDGEDAAALLASGEARLRDWTVGQEKAASA
ncbi:MAG: diguanylate cyclase, partial [Dehalococcoidia bacterium]|nr:diguanylate cyclase [Dehalococcoidia bacterium]